MTNILLLVAAITLISALFLMRYRIVRRLRPVSIGQSTSAFDKLQHAQNKLDTLKTSFVQAKADTAAAHSDLDELHQSIG